MFTGIIQYIGSVKSVITQGGGVRLAVDIGGLAEQVKLGDSVSVNGLCLTAAKINKTIIEFDVSPESLKRTTAAKLTIGTKVNIELAMKADGRFGGHIVQGHIDGTAKIKSIQQINQYKEITFQVDKSLIDEMVEKGSVAVSGISLTISKMDRASFSVAVIPTTLKETILNDLKVGDQVNIETDIICKMVKKQMNQITSKGNLTEKALQDLGY